MPTILNLNSSGRIEQSASRELGDVLSKALAGETGTILQRDLVRDPVELVDEAWIEASFTPPADRSDAQTQRLAHSNALLDEVRRARHIVIGAPMYNYAIPAALKAWIDMIARAHETFRYVLDDGDPRIEGMIEGKTAWIVIPTGGTALDSDIDFATPYLKYVLGFVGIRDVRVVNAAGWRDMDASTREALRQDIRAQALAA